MQQTANIQEKLDECESDEESNIILDFRENLFAISFKMDKKLERDSSRADDNFSFSVMFA